MIQSECLSGLVSLCQKFVKKKFFLDLGGHIETLKRKHIINFKRNLVNFHGLIQD